MSSVPKIVIKARRRAATSSEGGEEDPQTMDVDQEEPEAEEQSEGQEEEQEQEEEPEDEPEPEPEEVVPVVRKRGRPRGRGRGGGFAGSTAPRGTRGRGRGRGRGRPPKTFTIRLPRKGDDDDEGAEGDGEGGEDGDDEYSSAKPSRTIQNVVYYIEGDEFVTEDDPKGDTKIDKNGNLLGGRRFKAATFTLPNRHPERQYMLAIDAARTSGFRDSLYYFRRNPLALKLNATQIEKDYLIAEGKLGSHLRTRSVTLITARSAYKLHGAKMILDGRWVTDDYYEEKVLAEITERGLKAGDPVGELPDPNATGHGALAAELSGLASSALSGSLPSKGDRTQGGIYRAGGPTTIFGGSGWGPYSDGPLNAVRKSILTRDGVSEENWMYMCAMRVREADEEWARWRAEGRKGPEAAEGLDALVKDMGIGISGDGAWGGVVTGKRLVETEEGLGGAYEPHTHQVFCEFSFWSCSEVK